MSNLTSTLLRRFCCTVATPSSSEGLPLYRRLSALGGRAAKGSVKLTMNKWLREGKSVRAKEIIGYVKHLRKYGRYNHALELMEWMDTRGMNMSYPNYALRMHLLSRADGVDSAEKYFMNLPELAKNHLTYGALLNIYCEEKMTYKAMHLYEKMKDLGYDDTLVYNNLMGLFVKTNQLDKVPPLLEEIKVKRIRMDSFTYSTLISFYANVGDIEAIDRTVQQMAADHPSCQQWPVYSNLASVYISKDCMEKAKSSLKRLEEIMNNKDRAGYHHLMTLYARMGNLMEVKRIWTSLKVSLNVTNKSYLVLLQALYTLNDFDALQQYFHEWDSKHESYDVWLVNVMIGAYLRRDMVCEAKSLLENAIAKGAEPDWRTFKLFIEYYMRNHDMQSALTCFKTAATKLQVFKLDESMVDSFLQYFEEKGDPNGANTFCKLLKMLDSVEHSCLTSTITDLESSHEQDLDIEEGDSKGWLEGSAADS